MVFGLYNAIIPENPEKEYKFDVFDDIEAVIGDDTFAALLNFDGEIEVDGKIYKYTDVGLFYANTENYSDIQDDLTGLSISASLMQPTKEANATAFLSSLGDNLGDDDIIISISPNVVYRQKPKEPNPTEGGGTVYNPVYTSEVDPDFNAFSSQLQNCTPDSGLSDGKNT